jgi:hypothetical protein
MPALLRAKPATEKRKRLQATPAGPAALSRAAHPAR